MKTVARLELKPGMTLGADVLWQDKILFSTGTVLSQYQIEKMKRYAITTVMVMEDADFASTHYEWLRFSQQFKNFEQKHAESLFKYKKLMHDYAHTGSKIPDLELLAIYNTMRSTYSDGSVLLDYLYNLLPNEDELTYNHCLNSALLAGAFAEWLKMPESDKVDLILSGFCYDIGKLKIPYDLLWNPEKLTPEEFNTVKMHPVSGWNMLSGTDIPQNVLDAVLMHHERMDGSGYPNQITGSDISICARYIAIIDIYIAMASPRPHRNALTPLHILEYFEQNIHKFDPELLIPLMRHIADAQIGSSVELSDESVWNVFAIHDEKLSRPILKNSNQETLDLIEHPELEIVKMV